MNFLHGVIKRPYEGLNYFLINISIYLGERSVVYPRGGGVLSFFHHS